MKGSFGNIRNSWQRGCCSSRTLGASALASVGAGAGAAAGTGVRARQSGESARERTAASSSRSGRPHVRQHYGRLAPTPWPTGEQLLMAECWSKIASRRSSWLVALFAEKGPPHGSCSALPAPSSQLPPPNSHKPSRPAAWFCFCYTLLLLLLLLCYFFCISIRRQNICKLKN